MEKDNQLWTPGKTSGLLDVQQKNQLLVLVNKWRDILDLRDWRIEISEKAPPEGHEMEIAINRLRKRAFLRARTVDEQTVIHELLHLITDPIMEEHEIQMKSLHTPRKEEYDQRIVNEVEKVVEKLSLLFYNR